MPKIKKEKRSKLGLGTTATERRIKADRRLWCIQSFDVDGCDLHCLLADLCCWTYDTTLELPPCVKEVEIIENTEQETMAGLFLLHNGDIIVAFRGTLPTSLKNHSKNVMFLPAIRRYFRGEEGGVHRGFYMETLPMDELIRESRLWKERTGKLYITGHSKGGGQAQVFASFLLHRYVDVARVVVFGSPRVFMAFTSLAIEIRLTRYTHVYDAVPCFPRPCMGYRHTGHNILLDSSDDSGKHDERQAIAMWLDPARFGEGVGYHAATSYSYETKKRRLLIESLEHH